MDLCPFMWWHIPTPVMVTDSFLSYIVLLCVVSSHFSGLWSWYIIYQPCVIFFCFCLVLSVFRKIWCLWLVWFLFIFSTLVPLIIHMTSCEEKCPSGDFSHSKVVLCWVHALNVVNELVCYRQLVSGCRVCFIVSI